MTGPVSAEKIETYLLGLNDKAKAALDKGAKLGEEFAEFAKGNLEAAAESTKIVAKAAESLAQEGTEFAKTSYETATASLKRYGAVKTPVELFQLNSELAKSSFDTAMTQATRMSEAAAQLANDFFQPLSARYAAAAEKFKSIGL